MIAATVWTQLITTLQNSSHLTYIKNVFKGFRYNIEPESMPCIMVEPVSNNEIEQDLNQYKKIYLNLEIAAFTYCVSDPEKVIVGDANYKGILEIENDIRACLVSSYSLGGNVIDIKFDISLFDRYEDKYPIRGVLIPIKILYQQNNVA